MRIIILIIVALGLAVSSGSAVEVVDGVFGLSGVDDATSLAVWIPLDSGAAISGVRWFNNDETAVFPELLAIAGEVDQPELLVEATIVGISISGKSSGWEEFLFVQPLASATSGLYLVFRLPPGSDFESEGLGGGAGFGYLAGDGLRKCWLSGGDEIWHPFSADFQMAVEAIPCLEKSAEVLVLGKPGTPRKIIGEDKAKEKQEISFGATPNPFNPQTDIRFNLQIDSIVNLVIYDVRGRVVRTLKYGTVEKGSHVVTWDGRDDKGRGQASGVYLVRLQVGKLQRSMRITLVR